MIPAPVKYFLNILLFGGIQVLFLKNFALFHVAFCLIYVHFVLQLHSDTPPLQILLLSFLLGIFIDIFYDYPGLHASALVALAFVRRFWLQRMAPGGGSSDDGFVPDISNGLPWFIAYALPLIFFHHLVLFCVETGFAFFWSTLVKVSASSLFTLAGVIVIQYLLPQRRRL